MISAQHTEQPDSFIIEIENMKVNHLVNEFGNDFDVMARHLKIMNKRMVLLNPVSIFEILICSRNSSTKIKMARKLQNNSKTKWAQKTQTKMMISKIQLLSRLLNKTQRLLASR